MTSVPAGAAGVDDADERLFHVQLAIAEKGDVRAQYFLGEMHEQGLGTKQDLDEAFKWYAKAAEKGDTWAKRKLAHRAEIEADLRQERAQQKTAKTVKSLAPSSGKPKTANSAAKSTGKAKTLAIVAQTSESAIDEEKTGNEEKIKAVEREKRRAAVRAMILERIRHPVGELFE